MATFGTERKAVSPTAGAAPRAAAARPRVWWGPVLAGLLVSTGLQVLLSLFGLATGLAVEPPSGARVFAVGTAIWTLLTALVSLFVGGMTTGRLAGVRERGEGLRHGVLLWGLSILLAVALISRGGRDLFGGTLSLTATVVGGAAGAPGAVAGTWLALLGLGLALGAATLGATRTARE